MTEIFSLIPSDIGRPLTDIAHQLEDSGDLKADIVAVFHDGKTIERRVRSAGNGKSYLMRILPYRSDPPVIDGALLVFIDVSRLAQHEVQQQLMVEELNHRVRNMLAMVTALAVQILRHSDTLEDFERDFMERIHAIAKSYALVSHHRWGTMELRTILTDAAGLFQTDSAQRFRLEGPAVRFNPSTALTLGMVLHELATNAVKYGALSVPAGRIAVTWKVSPDGLALDWIESGGPPVQPPARVGFGSTLIKRLLEAGFSGMSTFDYRPEGLQVHISLPPDDSIYEAGTEATLAPP